MISLAAWVVLGQMAGTLTVSDRTEARLRSVSDRSPAIDVETAPVVGVTLDTRRTNIGLGYGLRLGLIDLQRDAQFIASHRLGLRVSWIASRRLRLTLAEDGGLGREVFSALAQPQTVTASGERRPATVTFVPTQEVVYVGSLRSSAGMTYLSSPNWSETATAYYEISGGLDSTSERAFPRHNTIGGDVGVTYRLTRVDQLATSAAGTHTDVTTTGGEFVTGTLFESWQHNLSPQTMTTVGAGLSYLGSRLDRQADRTTSFMAAARSEISTTRPLEDGAQLGLFARASLDTQYNGVLGAVTRQAAAAIGATWARRRWNADAQVAASTTLPSDSTPTVRGISGSVAGTYALTQAVGLQVGARGAGQLLPEDDAVSTPLLWVVFAALTVSAPLAQF